MPTDKTEPYSGFANLEFETGNWLRDLAALVDKKDALIQELQARVNNRLVVAWMHPKTRNIIPSAVKMIAEQMTGDSEKDRMLREHTIPLFAEIDPKQQRWKNDR